LVIRRCPIPVKIPQVQLASKGGRKLMLQWNIRLVAVLAVTVAISVATAFAGIGGGYQFGW